MVPRWINSHLLQSEFEASLCFLSPDCSKIAFCGPFSSCDLRAVLHLALGSAVSASASASACLDLAPMKSPATCADDVNTPNPFLASPSHANPASPQQRDTDNVAVPASSSCSGLPSLTKSSAASADDAHPPKPFVVTRRFLWSDLDSLRAEKFMLGICLDEGHPLNPLRVHCRAEGGQRRKRVWEKLVALARKKFDTIQLPGADAVKMHFTLQRRAAKEHFPQLIQASVTAILDAVIECTLQEAIELLHLAAWRLESALNTGVQRFSVESRQKELEAKLEAQKSKERQLQEKCKRFVNVPSRVDVTKWGMEVLEEPGDDSSNPDHHQAKRAAASSDCSSTFSSPNKENALHTL
eukprot:m.88954 g.88954  ORF g.88954 m.88954 type:complete len:354 (+) comp18098_c3_seq1:82-1143(+)